MGVLPQVRQQAGSQHSQRTERVEGSRSPTVLFKETPPMTQGLPSGPHLLKVPPPIHTKLGQASHTRACEKQWQSKLLTRHDQNLHGSGGQPPTSDCMKVVHTSQELFLCSKEGLVTYGGKAAHVPRRVCLSWGHLDCSRALRVIKVLFIKINKITHQGSWSDTGISKQRKWGDTERPSRSRQL